jgi:drug/metabolite transporter (DMT)-like permease
MSLLVRLYPQAWRERYGDELAALLDDRPPGPFDVADLLLGALDAHLHLRALGHRSDHRKGLPMSLRLGGWAAVVAGGSWTLFFAIAAASYANQADYGPAWIAVVLIAGLASLVALAGMSAFQFRERPRSIWIAFLVPAMGIGIVLIGLAILVQTGDWAAREDSVAFGVIYGGLSLMLVGSMVFAAVTVLTGALSRIAAGAIVVGGLPTLPSLFGSMAAVWLLVGGIVFGLGWIGLGLDAIHRDRRPVSPAPVAA